MTISICGVTKTFGAYRALEDIDLDIREGELLAVLGPSGSGKTTLLRIIAGLERPDDGKVMFGGDDVTDLRAERRRCGFVFQHYALFRHLSVTRNVSFGLDVRGAKPRDIQKRVEDLLRLVELEGSGQRFPSQLSGGQRQRVALARALAVEPRVLLLDEPFGALDATVRRSLRRELRRIHDATGVTTLFVTHDQAEALELADRVAVLNAGRLEQVGGPEDVLERPATAFVAGFVGDANRFTGEVRQGRFFGAIGEWPAAGLADGPAQAFVRPHDFHAVGEGGLQIQRPRLVFQGALARIEGSLDGQAIEALVARQSAEGCGSDLRLTVRQAHVFPA